MKMKYWLICLIRLAMKGFYIFPVKKNRIYFSADRGTAISCNPKYIFQYMKNQFPGKYEYIWEYDKDAYEGVSDVTIVRPHTLKANYFMLTSKVIISNDGLGSYIPKRKNQCFINTWHGGGAYKKVGEDTIADPKSAEVKINKLCGSQTDIFISSSRKFTEVMSEAKKISHSHFMECGMPRNDFLINGTDEDVNGKVKAYFGIPKDKKIVLFAPTYRGVEGKANCDMEINVKSCLEALQKRFGGEWVFLMRKHHFVKEMNNQGCLDASTYPDMQELLYAVDVFMTDYSSTIWDYSLMDKPGFLFVPDLEEYTRDRSFYTDPETWAFPLAKSNEELEQEILNYDSEKSREKIEAHHKYLVNKETGKATSIIADYIVKKCSE